MNDVTNTKEKVSSLVKVIVGITVIIVLIYFGGIAFSIYTGLALGDIWKMSPTGWGLVGASGVIAVIGYILYQFKAISWAKICLNLSPILLFFGSYFVEATAFAMYINKVSTITVNACTETFTLSKIEDLPIFTTCLFTGYYPSQGTSFTSLSFLTFVLFYWFLPFFFLFFFLRGLVKDTFKGLFGSESETVTNVLVFIIAAYGARQMIGSFLIDFAAYGAWGLVGIFIPLMFAVFLKRILDWAIPVEIEENILWKMIGMDVWAELSKAKDELNNVKRSLEGMVKAGVASRKEIERLIGVTEYNIALLEGMRMLAKSKEEKASITSMIEAFSSLKRGLKEVKEKIPKKAPS
jgi:hypothetical protein